jgi:hypothetical protein
MLTSMEKVFKLFMLGIFDKVCLSQFQTDFMIVWGHAVE